MKKSIAATIKRFPDQWDRICHLRECDGDFRALCKDYCVALEALEHWRRLNFTDGGGRVQEYEVIVKELENEIQQYLLGNAGEHASFTF